MASLEISKARFDLSMILTVLTSSPLKIYDSYDSLIRADELLLDFFLFFPALVESSSLLLKRIETEDACVLV